MTDSHICLCYWSASSSMLHLQHFIGNKTSDSMHWTSFPMLPHSCSQTTVYYWSMISFSMISFSKISALLVFIKEKDKQNEASRAFPVGWDKNRSRPLEPRWAQVITFLWFYFFPFVTELQHFSDCSDNDGVKPSVLVCGYRNNPNHLLQH